MSRRIFFLGIGIILFMVGILPVLSMFLQSLFVNGQLNLSAYQGILSSSHQWILMGHSMLLSLLVSIATLAIGIPLGILFSKTDLPLRKVFVGIFTIPLLIPPYIFAISWFDLLGREGILQHLIGSAGTKITNQLLFGLPGCAFVLFSIFLPIPMLLTMISLRTIPPRLEEAGRLVSNWWGVLKGISIPFIYPSILLAGLLVFLLSFGEFSVPNFLRYDVFPVESFIQFSAFYNFQEATAAAIPLAIVPFLLLFIESKFLRERTYQLPPSSELEHSSLIKLGVYRKWVFTLVTIIALIIVIVPIAVLVVESRNIKIYIQAIAKAKDSIVRSIVYASASATLLTFMGFFMGYLIQKKVLKYWRVLDSFTLFLFALPSTVLGIGLISLWNTHWTNIVYSTPLIILLGYLAKYLALTSRICVTQLAQLPSSMEEAAQIAGAGWFYRMLFIVAPLTWQGLVGSWLVGYIFSMRDIGVTMLVYPPGHETLPVRIFTLMANGAPQFIAALCVVMISLTLFPAGIFWIFFNLLKSLKFSKKT